MDVTLEKVLVSQNEELLSFIKGDLSQFNAPFRKLVSAYEGLNLGELTSEVFEEIKAGFAQKSVRRYEKALEEGLDATKVYNPTLRANLLAGTEIASKDFLTTARDFTSFEAKVKQYNRDQSTALTLDYIGFEDGELVITDESSEKLLDRYCRFYLESENEHRLFKAISTICEQYKILCTLNKQLELDMILNHNLAPIGIFFSKVGPNIEPNIDQIKGSCSYAARKAKHRL